MFALILGVFTSCEREMVYTRYIVNDSSFEIKIVFFNQNAELFGDTVVIEGNSTAVIEDYYEQGVGRNGVSCAPTADGILVFANSAKATFSKNLFEESNWEKDLTGKRSIDQDCFFEISAADVVVLD